MTRHLVRSGLRDNHTRGSVADFLRQHLKPQSHVTMVSAYFTIYAYGHLKAHLDAVANVKFLFGEPRFLRHVDPEEGQARHYAIEGDGLRLQNRLSQRQVARDCARWIEEKVDIRSVRRSNFMHGKMYHITSGGKERAILGSSNFTVRGLGLAPESNIELNLEVDGDRDREDLRAWFEGLWTDEGYTTDVKAEVLTYLERLYRDQAPEFVYYKTLFHLFGEYLSREEQSILASERSRLTDTGIWHSLFEFQRDGVRAAITKLEAYGGCILADSVGLGKTYSALAVIKHYELLNARVLVLCPKKLRENWTVYLASVGSGLNPFAGDRFGYTVLSHTDLSREGGVVGDVRLDQINWGNYDLVVIDESHNFRNNTRGHRDETGTVVHKSRYERLLEDVIQAGVKTKVLLLSATPVNNELRDLRNQVMFISEGRDDAFGESLGIGSVTNTLNTAQKVFNTWAAGNRQGGDLFGKLSASFFKLLDALTIARSRKHIARHYPETLARLGGFPQRERPESVYAETDLSGHFPSYTELNRLIEQYQLAVFAPSRYLRPEHQAQYTGTRVANFSQANREHFLIGMMKVNFLKRLESSVASFAVTMERAVAKIDALLAQIEAYEARGEGRTVDLSLEPEGVEGDEEFQAAALVGRTFVYDLAHLNLPRWRQDLEADRAHLADLHQRAVAVTPGRDAKLAQLRRIITDKARQPTQDREGQPNRKLLVFTAFADTAAYLYRELTPLARELGIHIGLVTGSGSCNATFGEGQFHHVLTNFSPRSKRRELIRGMPQQGEIDLLIATDCISEGQNLQDCDLVVNYDIHWNPVRLVQRFGRIDRIGSLSDRIKMVNFWPTPDLNQYLGLQGRVEARMALVDLAATAEDNPLAGDDASAAGELRYRDQQLLRLKDEVLDLEDLSDGVNLSEFTLDEFRLDLLRYLEANRRELEEAALGLYAVVPPDPTYPVIQGGIVFCLRQVGAGEETAGVNPLAPHVLVYVRDDGEVRFTFTQPKQTLEVLRVLCGGVSAPHETLCRLFDEQTAGGEDVSAAAALLAAATRSIARHFQKRAAQSLLLTRDGTLPPRAEQAREETPYELVTWVVIKDANP